MNEIDPLVLYHVVREGLGVLFWPVSALLAVVTLALLAAVVRAWRRGRFGRILGRALLVGLAVTALATLAVPAWTLAGLDALNGPVDVAVAVLFALVPGSLAVAAVFITSAARLRRA